jgi:hypothetical protein
LSKTIWGLVLIFFQKLFGVWFWILAKSFVGGKPVARPIRFGLLQNIEIVKWQYCNYTWLLQFGIYGAWQCCFLYPDSRARIALGASQSIGVKSMSNLSKAIAMLDSNPRLAAKVAALNTQTPPAILRDIVRNIESARNVTLAR